MKEYLPILAKRKLPFVSQTTAFNSGNGYDAEKLAAAVALVACGGEVRWSSRTEEGHKIDIILSFENPFYDGERMMLYVQVKSGLDEGRIYDGGFKLYKTTKDQVRRRTKAIVIIWVDRESGRSFWAYVHPFTTKNMQKYGRHHEISPAMKYDLARCEGHYYHRLEGGRDVTLSVKQNKFSEKRKIAREAYRKIPKEVHSPVLGPIVISRVGWRHMFRNNRSNAAKEKSTMVIPFLESLLSQKPSSIFHSKSESDVFPMNDFIIRAVEFNLTYEQGKIFDGTLKKEVPVKIILKCLEEIRYPKKWRDHGAVSQVIDRRITFLSCHYK